MRYEKRVSIKKLQLGQEKRWNLCSINQINQNRQGVSEWHLREVGGKGVDNAVKLIYYNPKKWVFWETEFSEALTTLRPWPMLVFSCWTGLITVEVVSGSKSVTGDKARSGNLSFHQWFTNKITKSNIKVGESGKSRNSKNDFGKRPNISLPPLDETKRPVL